MLLCISYHCCINNLDIPHHCSHTPPYFGVVFSAKVVLTNYLALNQLCGHQSCSWMVHHASVS